MVCPHCGYCTHCHRPHGHYHRPWVRPCPPWYVQSAQPFDHLGVAPGLAQARYAIGAGR